MFLTREGLEDRYHAHVSIINMQLWRKATGLEGEKWLVQGEEMLSTSTSKRSPLDTSHVFPCLFFLNCGFIEGFYSQETVWQTKIV